MAVEHVEQPETIVRTVAKYDGPCASVLCQERIVKGEEFDLFITLTRESEEDGTIKEDREPFHIDCMDRILYFRALMREKKEGVLV